MPAVAGGAGAPLLTHKPVFVAVTEGLVAVAVLVGGIVAAGVATAVAGVFAAVVVAFAAAVDADAAAAAFFGGAATKVAAPTTFVAGVVDVAVGSFVAGVAGVGLAACPPAGWGWASHGRYSPGVSRPSPSPQLSRRGMPFLAVAMGSELEVAGQMAVARGEAAGP